MRFLKDQEKWSTKRRSIVQMYSVQPPVPRRSKSRSIGQIAVWRYVGAKNYYAAPQAAYYAIPNLGAHRASIESMLL